MSFSFLFIKRKLLKQYLSIVSLSSLSKRKWEEKKNNFRQKEVALIKGGLALVLVNKHKPLEI